MSLNYILFFDDINKDSLPAGALPGVGASAGIVEGIAVVAREYGIPAVVGVSNATRKIQTGQKIRVDGNAGFVQVIE